MSEPDPGGASDDQSNDRRHGPTRGARPRRRHVIVPALAIKLALVVLIVVLPGWLAVGLGVVHGIAALVALVAVVAVVLVRRRSTREARLSKERSGTR